MAAAPMAQEPGSDEELVRRLQEGDESAFNALYDRYFDRVYRFLDRRMGNRADVEETTQEVFFQVFNSVHGFRGEAPFVAWVFGLTRRTLANRYKRKRHPTVSLSDGEGDAPVSSTAAVASEPSPHEAYEFHEAAKRLAHAAENDLNPEQQALFRLHHLENRPIAEIANQLGKSEDAVKSNLYRTRRILLAR